MSSQVPADCCIEQFALGAGRQPFRCLGQAGFENLQTMEVQILANGRESECIDQLCLWMAQAQIAERETWHFGPFLPLVESREERLPQFVSPTRQVLYWLFARQLSARDIEKTIYIDRHGCMKESADQCRPCFPPCQHPMKRIAERKSVHWREPIFEIVGLRETRQAPRGRECQMSCDLDRRNTVIHCFNHGSENRLRVFSKNLSIEIRLTHGSSSRPWRLLAVAHPRLSE